MTRRLFVALPVSPQLKDVVAQLPHKGLDARWMSPADLHITLRFLGDVGEEKIPAISDALSCVRRRSFYIEVRGLGVFNNERQAVLYAVVESTRKLNTLCADIGDALIPLGFDFGTRPYVPHVTLARINRGSTPENYIRQHEKQVAAHWQARNFSLMESAASDEKGSFYNMLSTHPLIS